MNNTQTPALPTFSPILTEENQLHTQPTNPTASPLSKLMNSLSSILAPTSLTFTELLTAYQTSIEKPPIPFILNKTEPFDPFAFSHQNLATATTSPTSAPQPVSWLWSQRIPSAGITLLDGDHGLGKTLLAHQIAAAVSSGSPMPDGSPTIQGGVIIVTPFTDPSTTQLQLLTSLGSDLSRIKILSFVPNQDPPPPQPSQFPLCNARPFSLPNDLSHLFVAIERIDARLILFDPFIYLLSSQHRTTNRHLCQLLTELNQYLLTHNIACLLVRNCRAKGGHAKPSTLEQSDHFLTIAASRLLLAPDPMQPDHILLSHALSRHSPLTPTLACRIQPLPANPNLAHFTLQGTHTLQACHLLTQRPDTLHRLLLAQQLLLIFADAPSSVPANALYALFPHSSISQIQHTLKDLLLQGHIQRPTRGFYTATKLNHTAATTSPVTTQPNPSAATTSPVTTQFNPSAATNPPVTTQLNSLATTTPDFNTTAATTLSTPAKLNSLAAITPSPTAKLDHTAAITLSTPAKLNHTAATTPPPTTKLNHTAATTPPITLKLNSLAATTPSTKTKLNTTAATTHNPKVTHSHKRNKPNGRPNQHKKRH